MKDEVVGGPPAGGDGPKFADAPYFFNPLTRVYVTWIPKLPKPVITTEEEHKSILRLYSNFSGKPARVNELSRALGWRREVVIGYLKAHNMTHDREPFSPEELAERDPEDIAREEAEIRRQRAVQAIQNRKWQDVIRDAEAYRHLDITILSRLTEAIGKGEVGGDVPRLALPKARRPHAVVQPSADLHYGMRGVDGYDRKAARRTLLEATERWIAEARAHGRPEKIIASTVGDWGHIDYQTLATRKGTPQDCDGTYDDIVPGACDLRLAQIDLLRQLAPVEVCDVPGNHDPSVALTLHLVVKAKFGGAKNVTVREYAPRVYTTYGKTLIGFTHQAKTPKGVSLGQVMANERPKDWARCPHRVFVCGDLHHKIDEDQLGCLVLTMATVCGFDRWHRDMKYAGTWRALPGLRIDREQGMVAQIAVPVGE